MESFRTGACQFSLQSKIRLSCGETIAIWSSQDALVIKVLTGIMQETLKPFLLKTCYHLNRQKEHGKAKIYQPLKRIVLGISLLRNRVGFTTEDPVRIIANNCKHFFRSRDVLLPLTRCEDPENKKGKCY